MEKAGNNRTPLLCAGFVAVFLSACSSGSYEDNPASQLHVDGESIFLDGPITNEIVQQLRQLSAEHNFTRMQVNSAGGDPLAAIQLGGWIHRQQLDISVQQECLHSCANYLFTAGANKEIQPGGVVAWSGGALEDSWTQQWQNYLIPGIQHIVEQYLDRFLRREIRFFERIDVDQRITVYGYDDHLGCMQDDIQGFYYSVPDLLAMGVSRVQTPGSSWQQAFSDYGEQFCKVELSSRPEVIRI